MSYSAHNFSYIIYFGQYHSVISNLVNGVHNFVPLLKKPQQHWLSSSAFAMKTKT